MTIWNMLAYGCIDFYGGGAFFIIGSLYVVYLTIVVGLSPIQAGIIILAGKVWSAFANPIVGYISDNTRSRFGRRRTYFIFGLVPIFGMLWLPVSFDNPASTYAYHFSMYLVYNTLFAVTKIPYNSILTEMTPDYSERSKAMGVRMIFSQGGSFIGAFLPLTIITAFRDQAKGYFVFGSVFGILYAIPWIFGFFGTWDRPVVIEKSGNFIAGIRNVFASFWSTMRNRTFMIHMGMYLLAFLNLDIFNGIFIFFAVYSLGNDLEAARNVLTLIQASQFLAIPLVTVASYRLGTAIAYRLSLLVWGIGIVALSLMASGTSFFLLIPFSVITGMGLSGAVMIPWNNQTFMADIDELITTRRREGVYAGFMQFIRQIAIGLGLFMTNVMLQYFGFVKGSTVQPPSFGEGVRWYLMISPVIILGIGAAISFLFKLDPSNHKALLREIDRLKKGGEKEAVTPGTREICEKLTGQPYQKLWDPGMIR
jgi:oligogalacturonide transporter